MATDRAHIKEALAPSGPTLASCAGSARQLLPRHEADDLACRVLNVSRAELHAFGERCVPRAAAERLSAAALRCAEGEPMAYILGMWEFCGLTLEINPRVLIPRLDTEVLVEAALDRMPRNKAVSVLDIGTGSGAVALAIAAERPKARVLATDIDPECCALARRNAERLGLDIDIQVADCMVGIKSAFDVIVSNPPYVATSDAHLAQGDLRFEPRLALTGEMRRAEGCCEDACCADGCCTAMQGDNSTGADGLGIISRIVAGAMDHLACGGRLLIEHGHDQGPAVRALFQRAGLFAITTREDLEGRDRVTGGYKF